MSTKQVKMETKTAVMLGYYGGRRIRPTETFTAPVEEKARWFVGPSDGKQAVEDAPVKSNIKSIDPKDAASWAASATSAEINEAIGVEQGSGSPRKNILKQLQNELANRVGKTGGPDPAAKQLEEKDPLTTGEPLPDDELMS